MPAALGGSCPLLPLGYATAASYTLVVVPLQQPTCRSKNSDKSTRVLDNVPEESTLLFGNTRISL